MSRAEVFLHPLVMVNMADHYTREKISSGGIRAVGAFMGVQEGASVSVLDSTEMRINWGKMEIDLNLLKRKLDLMKAVFPRFEFLGWYVTGQALSDMEMLSFQKQVQVLNESPLVMIMGNVDELAQTNNQMAVGKKKKILPVSIYETVMQMINDQPVQTFVEVQVQVDTTESERVTVDTIVTQKGGGSSSENSSTLNPHMASLKNAVQMLRGRVMLLKKFLELSKSGQIPMDYSLLREAVAICNQLPCLEPSQLEVDFNAQLGDALLISLLSAVTKETAAANAILEKFFIAYPTPGQPEKEKTDRPKSKRGLTKRIN